MQNSPVNLRAQLQHTTRVLDGFVGDVQVLKKESSQLVKSVNTLAREHLKQCRRLHIDRPIGEAQRQKLDELRSCSQLIHAHADNLNGCLDAVLNRSYKPDLKRAEQGKPTKVLVDCEQEAGTFETHIRLAENLVATVLPFEQAINCYNQPRVEHRNARSLMDAFQATKGLSPAIMNVGTQLICELSVVKLNAAAAHLRDQIEAPGVRQRVQPFSLNR
jgi:hypothetical protein